MKIVFLHPDLGIGGAERLVVDAGLALKSKGHFVHFVTAHHDTSHCFSETKDGTLPVTCVGDWLPRSYFGRCQAICAYFRMVYAAMYLVFFSKMSYDVVICDQVSACIPVLKLKKPSRILFYCHFPDQLLTQRKNWLKKVYRAPIDWLEETTTGKADKILVNSKFTAEIFRDTFRRLKVDPDVLYPSLNFASFDSPVTDPVKSLRLPEKVKTLFLSINRYERKKQLSLAIFALAKLRDRFLSPSVWPTVHLVVAGGYDELVSENVEHFRELLQLVDDLGLEDNVTFLRSISDTEKKSLLHSCTALVYTPHNEHFGIVPIEAMYMSRPVIAVNSGGPRETVLQGTTGFLCTPTPHAFAEAFNKFVMDKDSAREMGRNGRVHVEKTFSYDNFVKQLDNVVGSLCQM